MILHGMQTPPPRPPCPGTAINPPTALPQPMAPSSAAPSAPQEVLRLQGLKVRYPGSALNVLDGLDLRLHQGETLALVGPSGCGKSTVARAVLQLLPPGSLCEGNLELTGTDPRRLSASALQHLRGQAAGLVFQDPMTRLNPLMTVGEHLRDTLEAHRRQPTLERARGLLERVGIDPARYGSYPHEFSGGMRQRLAIALALALNPPLVIADEPTTSLDVAVTAQVMGELSDLCAEAGSALLLISHDLAMAGRWCERIAEAAWLLALTLIPLFFNLYSARHFEPDKAAVLRSLALVAITAVLIRATAFTVQMVVGLIWCWQFWHVAAAAG